MGGGAGFGFSYSPNGDVDTVAPGDYCYAEFDTPWADFGVAGTLSYTLYTLDVGWGYDVGISVGQGHAK
jgi:hypothetical protein